MNKSNLINTILAILIFLVLFAAIYAYFSASCNVFQFVSAKDIPARCTSYFYGGRQ